MAVGREAAAERAYQAPIVIVKLIGSARKSGFLWRLQRRRGVRTAREGSDRRDSARMAEAPGWRAVAGGRRTSGHVHREARPFHHRGLDDGLVMASQISSRERQHARQRPAEVAESSGRPEARAKGDGPGRLGHGLPRYWPVVSLRFGLLSAGEEGNTAEGLCVTSAVSL